MLGVSRTFGKDWKGSVRDYRPAGNSRSHVNPIEARPNRKRGLPDLLSGRSLKLPVTVILDR